MIDFSIKPAPELGVSINNDVIEIAVRACLDDYGFDIGALPKAERDQIFLAVLDAWTDWPIDNNEASNAASGKLKSIAIAGRWDHLLLPRR